MHYHIRQPQTRTEFKHYYHLRWKLLRAPWNQPEGSESDDLEAQCFHLMAVTNGGDDKNKVIGIARLQFNSHSEAQIRYMAVSESCQRQGIGRELINRLEQRAKQSLHQTMVLDARENAVGFYKKLGYRTSKKSYRLFDAIQHYRMTKNIC